MIFEEVDVVYALGPHHPDYKKPDIGDQCYVIYKQFLSWKHVLPSCMPNASNPDKWTIINTPLGSSVIDMPYKQVKKKIEEAYFFFEKEDTELRKQHLKDIIDGMDGVLKNNL